MKLANRRITASRGGAGTPSTPHFSQPVRQILLMLSVLALVLAGGWFTYGRILPIFMANKWLNGLILAVFAVGVLACFWQVGQLVRSVSWIERFADRRRNAVEKGLAARSATDTDIAPRLLAPLAALLGNRGPAGGVISTGSARSILDSVATRIDELRDITRYLSNLLIFLGLLGTFYGLATTVPAVVETIRALAPQDGETGLQVFEKLMGGLEAQLGGMATAFSSSLLGLAGSLVVGLLELFVTHGQNRFYRELEEWMSGFTRVSLADSESGGIDQATMSGAVDHLAAQMDRLQSYHSERDALRDESAIMADERIVVMAESVEALTRRVEAEQEASVARIASLSAALNQMVEGQNQLISLAKGTSAPPPTADLTGIEAALDRLTGDLSSGRDEMVAELRSDLLILTRAVRAARFGDPFPDDLQRDPLIGRDRS
ncbi:biopolymer transporter ExbB [Paracoccus sp. Z330]|uniref:Biopolymer transporter ExbB n=1 Tax=Paracoccus onchidii TaxID=3017813 RepID=A0ABT4ZC82_9RHOB|nr:biopolymer transporter ExbB [Paracoccus onchidii]MDB6176981.1 biopolymer transporter ExbB [Paracoccus onchidii]